MMQNNGMRFSKYVISIVLSLLMIMAQVLPVSFAGYENPNERISLNPNGSSRQLMPPNPNTYPEFYKQNGDSTEEKDSFETSSLVNSSDALSSAQLSSDEPRKDLVSKKKLSPSEGSTEKVLVIPISFANKNFTVEHNTAYYQSQMDQLKDYYEKNSKYVFNSKGISIEATIVDPVATSKTMEYYGQDSDTDNGWIDDIHPVEDMAAEALELLATRGVDDLNLNSFDKNSDGIIDHIIFIHAGSGQEEFENSDLIWSCSSELFQGKTIGGKVALNFITIAEDSTLGVCAHEFGHDLGLPDLYDTDGEGDGTPDGFTGETLGVGDWDLMGSGSWNHLPGEADGTCPSNLSAWCKMYLGWLTPTNITSNGNYSLYNTTGNDQAYKLWTGGNSNGDEYYLTEYRRKNGYDASLPGEGLLVWHIDKQFIDATIDENMVNAYKGRLGIELEQADGYWDLWLPDNDDPDYIPNFGDAGDPFTGTNCDEGLNNFSALPYGMNYSNISSPAAFSYVEIRNIYAVGNSVSADYFVSTGTPSAPVIILPAANSIVSTRPAFSWKMVNQAEGYRLEIAEDPGFPSYFKLYTLDGSKDENLKYNDNGFTFTLPSSESLVEGKTYYWRVAGYNSSGEGAWSTVQKIIVSSHGGQSSGVAGTDMQIERIEHGSAVANDKIYSVGGYDTDYGVALSSLEFYNTTTEETYGITDMPAARQSAAVVSLNNSIYVIGGDTKLISTPYSNTVFAYDPAAGTWTAKANLLYPKTDLTAVVVDGKIYAIGGHGSETDVEVYDPGTNTWTKKADMPYGRFGSVAAAIGSKIYVIGGYISKKVTMYDTVTDTWTEKMDAPIDIYYSAAVAINDNIYIMGGGTGTRTVMQYDPGNDTWTPYPDLLAKRARHTIANIGGKVYLMGGTADGISLKSVEVYQIVSHVALNTPNNLVASSASNNSITLSWNAVSGATGYYVSVNDQEFYATTNSYTVNSLNSNTKIKYKVRAVNTYSTSEWSEEKTAYTTGAPQITASANITESSENGSVITVALTNGIFQADGNYNKATVVLNPAQLPRGVKEGSVTRIDDTTLQIGLVGNRTDDYDSDLTVNIAVDMREISTGRYTSPSAVVTFDAIVEAKPSSPSITFSFDGPNTGRLMGSTSGMEFSLDGGSTYVAVTSSDQTLSTSQLNAITAANDVRVRIKASGAPASDPCIINILSGPAAPAVTGDDTINTVAGINNTMEFSTDGVNWTKYNNNLPGLTDTITIRVRIPGTGVTAPGTPVVLTFTASSGGGEGGGGGGFGGGGGVEEPAAAGSGGSGPAEVKIDKLPLVNSSGIAKTSISGDNIDEAMKNAKKNKDGQYELVVNIPKAHGADGYALTLPTNMLKAKSDATGTILQINSPVGNITLPDNMIQQDNSQLLGKNVELVLGHADKNQLPPDLKNEIGDRPVIDIHFNVNGQSAAWENPNAPVTLSIPYSPTQEEWKHPENIVVWYVDGTGNAVEVPSGRYDQTTGKVTFTVTHFSQYAVAYYQNQLTDINGYSWAEKEIVTMVGKGILKGRTETTFEPGNNITRAEFLYGLVRALGLTGSVGNNFGDVEISDYYYQEIALAKQLGITNGNGSNLFGPDEDITRQDMMTLMTRALKITNKLATQNQTVNLNQFSDSHLIALYAKDSIINMVSEGIIKGDGKNINPLRNTTRAEGAVILFRIYNK